MGIIIGKLRRKKTTVEVLETIDKEIKNIEEYRKNTEQTHKRIVARFIVISVGVYLLTAFLFYFYYFPANFYDRLFYIIPLIFAPVIILTVKRVLGWYYKFKINRKQNKLVTLREEKKKLLDKVMDTETYKVAKLILEKFAEPIGIRKSAVALLSSSEYTTPLKHSSTPTSSKTAVTAGLRQRTLPPLIQEVAPSVTPVRSIANVVSTTAVRPHTARVPMTSQLATLTSTPLPMPRSILPRDRSVFDKMVDYLVGDGPSNRYALICKNCSSHNGMALHEEFEYISFRCCYCYTFNPARKKRPVAPRLEFELKSQTIQADTSDSEKNSQSDSDSESDTLNDLKTTTLHYGAENSHEETKTVNSLEEIEPVECDVSSSKDVKTNELEEEKTKEDIGKTNELEEEKTKEDIGNDEPTSKD